MTTLNSFKWKGKPVDCNYTDLTKGDYTFYRSFVVNDDIYDVGDFAVISKSGKTKDYRVVRILCAYESHETWHKTSKFRAVVKCYTWAREIQQKCNPQQIELDHSNEVVEDLRTGDQQITMDIIQYKCRVIYATEEDPADYIKQSNLNTKLFFLCRYKIEKTEIVPLFSDNMIDMTCMEEFTVLDLENASSIMNVTPTKNKNKRKGVLKNVTSSFVDDANRIESPQNSSKSMKLTPRNKSGLKNRNSNTPLNKESVKRNLNESFDTINSPVLNYSIVDQTPESKTPMKLKLKVSSKTPTSSKNEQLLYNSSDEHSDPVRRSHRSIQRISYADFISPRKTNLRERSNSIDSEIITLNYGSKTPTKSINKSVGALTPNSSIRRSTRDRKTPSKNLDVRRGSVTDSDSSVFDDIKMSRVRASKVAAIANLKNVTSLKSDSSDENDKIIKNPAVERLTRSTRKSILKVDSGPSTPRKQVNYKEELCDSPTKRKKEETTPRSEDDSLPIPKITIKLNSELEKTPSRTRRKSILKSVNDCNTPKKSVRYINEDEHHSPKKTPKLQRKTKSYDESSVDETYTPKTRSGRKENQVVSDDDDDDKYCTPKKNGRRRSKKQGGTTPKRDLQNTPSGRAKLVRAGVITPSMHSRTKAIQESNTPLSKARTQLHVSYVPDALPCREKEFSDIYNFLEGKLFDGCGGCMYVSGVPGTGKTATVTEVIRKLQESCKKDNVPIFDYVNINGMRLTEPRQAYVEILKQLGGKSMPWEQAQSILEAKFTKGKKVAPIVLVVDELDILCTKRQDVVYNLLDWPTKATNQLIVITIANTMDLPERLLMGRVTSRLGLTRLTFQAYTHKQLQEIVTKRLIGTNSFNPDAIQLVARKVASVSGDARRALDICRRAAEIAETEGDYTLVSMNHVNEALNAMITQPKVQAIKHCSRLEQLILQAIVAEVERTGVEETNFSSVYSMLVSVAALDGFQMVSFTVTLAAVARLGACRLLLTDPKSNDMDQRIILNVSADDVYYALRND